MAQAQPTWVFEVPLKFGGPMIEAKQAASLEEATKLMAGWGSVGVGEVKFVKTRWDSHTDLGGYPLYYVTKDNGCLCPKCANENLELTLGDDPQWHIEQVDVNWENNDLDCDNCNEKIQSAYGEDDEDGTDNEGDG